MIELFQPFFFLAFDQSFFRLYAVGIVLGIVLVDAVGDPRLFEIKEKEDKRRTRGDKKEDGDELRYANTACADIERVSAKPFDPRSAKTVPCEVGKDDLTVELFQTQLIVKKENDGKAEEIPKGFV